MEKVERLLAAYQPLVEATSDMTASTATDDPNTMTGNLYSDRNLLDKYFVQPMQYFYEYSSRSEQVANRARQSAALYGERGAVYQQRESGAIYNLYAGRAHGQYGLAGRNRQAAEQRDGRIPRGI